MGRRTIDEVRRGRCDGVIAAARGGKLEGLDPGEVDNLSDSLTVREKIRDVGFWSVSIRGMGSEWWRRNATSSLKRTGFTVLFLDNIARVARSLCRRPGDSFCSSRCLLTRIVPVPSQSESTSNIISSSFHPRRRYSTDRRLGVMSNSSIESSVGRLGIVGPAETDLSPLSLRVGVTKPNHDRRRLAFFDGVDGVTGGVVMVVDDDRAASEGICLLHAQSVRNEVGTRKSVVVKRETCAM